MRPQFLELKTHCVVCTSPVPPERLKYKAITCCDAHARERKLSMRAKQDSRECRFCRKPTTPAEKAAYQRYRKWEVMNPNLAFPAQFKRWQETTQPTGSKFDIDSARTMADEDYEAAENARNERLAASTPMEPICEAGTSL